MAINFTSETRVTASERKKYDGLKKIELAFSDACSFWTGSADFKKEGFKVIRCGAECDPPKRDFYCQVADSDSVLAKFIRTPTFNLLRSQKVTEVRYGDIDKDGDIDIAVKLKDGAIYVFHNLSKS